MAKKTPKTSKKLHTKKGAWFAPLRGSYIPVSWQGWLTYIPFVAYLVFVIDYGWANASTHAMAVLYIVPNLIVAAVVMTYVAKCTS